MIVKILSASTEIRMKNLILKTRLNHFRHIVHSILIAAILIFSKVINAEQFKTIKIQGKSFTGRLDASGFSVVNSKGAKILSLPPEETEFVRSFRFEDFNRDGYKDIFLEDSQMGIGSEILYLFVPSAGKFREITNFFNFPNSIHIEGSKYFYSFSSLGCLGKDWISDLFIIKNNTAIQITRIEGEGCVIENGVHIYESSSQKSNSKKFIQFLPSNTFERYKDGELGFLKQYWTKNYKKYSHNE